MKRLIEDKENIYCYGDGDNLIISWDYLNDKYNICGVIDRKYNDITLKTEEQKNKLYTIYGSDEVKKIKKETKIIITCVYVADICSFLKKEGFTNIEHIFSLIEDERFHFHKYSPADDIYFDKVVNLLADDESKNVYRKIISFRKSGMVDYSSICSKEPQYFPRSIYPIVSEEVMVDVGAYVGDTIEVFKEITNNDFKYVYAFEADKNNFCKLSENNKNDNRIACYNNAVWNNDGILSFVENGDSGHVNDDALGTNVQAIRLDNVIKKNVTLIKMDIEGGEKKALEGAEMIIAKFKPKLAICIYHKKNDIWEIPLYLHEKYPWYKFSIRHHGKQWMETVLYAY